MTRSVPLLLLLVSTPLLSQGSTSNPGSGCSPPGPGETRLEVGIHDGIAYQYSCPDITSAPYTADVKLRITSPKKTWVTLVPHSFLVPDATTTGPNGFTTQDIINAYPWMAPPVATDPATLYPGWAGQPSLYVDPGLTWWFVWNALVSPVTGQLDDTGVRDLFVPILEDPGNPTAEHNTRTWSAKPPTWLADVSGYGIGPFMADAWEGTLYEYGPLPDAEVFSSEGIARLAIQLQAPNPGVAKTFMNSLMFADALSLGLHVNLQTVCAIDPNPAILPGGDDLSAPGLGLPTLPAVSFSPPITITVAIVAPLSGGGIPENPGTVTRGSRLLRKLRGVFPNTTVTFGGGVSAPVTWDGSLRHSLRHGVTIPQAAMNGSVSIMTPFAANAVMWPSVIVVNGS